MSVETVRQTLEHQLGWTVDEIHPVVGGDLNAAYRVEGPHGSRFVKSAPHAEPGTFAAEVAGLRWLGEVADGAPVAEVIGWFDPPAGEEEGGARLLALEWIDSGHLSPAAAAAFGRGLAHTHAAGAPQFGTTPWPGGGIAGIELTQRPSRLGPVTLPNAPADSFAEFYGRDRLVPLAHMAHAAGTFAADDVAEIEALSARLPDLCGPPEPPARCHGDLWTGNVLAGSDGIARLIDPAAHGGHREVDLAVLQLFGSPPAELFDAYGEVHPLASGHEQRRSLFQLGVVLLHVVLFGGSYATHALRIARSYR